VPLSNNKANKEYTMSIDIFQSNVKIGEGWKLDGAVIEFGMASDKDAKTGEALNDQILATSITIDYTRQTQQINPINQDTRYVVASDPSGTVRIGMVVGPSKKISNFVKQFGNVCNLAKNKITITPQGTQKCEDNGWPKAEKWHLTGCLMTGMSMSIEKTAGNNMVMGGITMSFLLLELGEPEDGGKTNNTVPSGPTPNA